MNRKCLPAAWSRKPNATHTCLFPLQAIKAKMDELRPLIPVLEAYKADARLVVQFREEAANVTALLSSLQEQLGGLDYQDLNSRVANLEERLRACMQKLGEHDLQSITHTHKLVHVCIHKHTLTHKLMHIHTYAHTHTHTHAN